MVKMYAKKITAFMSVVTMLLSMLLYFPGGMFSTYFGLKASAVEITLTEPSADNGVYQIGTAAELYWFADKVNKDNSNFGSASAVLTANITVNSNLLGSLTFDSDGKVSNGTDFTSWTPIGWYDIVNSVKHSYTGTFDGQGHTVSGLYFNNDADYVGLFGYIGTGGAIKNVGVVDSYINAYQHVGGVCGYNYAKNNGTATITNCYNTGTVSGNSEVGGVCGNNYAESNGTATITNCYNTGTVSGNSNVGGVCGANVAVFTGGTAEITNCYYLDTTATGGIGYNSGKSNKVEIKTKEQFGSGEVAYLLQGTQTEAVWGQTLTGTSNQDYP
ncbi:MAG: GLUG motif-containing protein, partial [Oscillospiraceae bacterium]